jgi:preprotein translocase subunit SecG
MENVIIVLTVVVALLLAVVVLIQNPKGGGLTTGFQTTQIGGVQQTADFLEKATWYLVIGLFVLCMMSASFSTTSKYSTGDEVAPATEQNSSETPAQ